MMRRNISEILALAAVALLAAGCAGRIDPQGECDGTVGFAVDVAKSIEEVKAGTKAGDAQTISSFKVAAFNNDGSDHEQFIAPDTEVTVSGSKGSTDIRWTKPYAKVFYAYANLPASGASVTPAYDGQTLEFTALPAVAENQTDVLLAAEATNGGDTRTAELSFKHALASVTFNAGQMQNVAAVNSITVKGVYSKGSVKQSSDGTFGAWSGTTEPQDITQTGLSVTPPESGSIQIGSTLLLIPQTGSIAIELGVTMKDTSTKTLAGTVSIDGNAWQAGYATTYTIGYTESKDLNFTANAVTWGTATAINTPQMETALPDPRYWVDLGAVTADGHKLYFAKYNVASIDANGNATFAETLGAAGIEFEWNDAASIKTVAGQSCRLPKVSELGSLLFYLNADYSVDVNDVVTLTGKATGLSDDKSLKIASGDYFCYDEYSIRSIADEPYASYSFASYIRLVTESEEVAPELSGMEVYSPNGGGASMCYILYDESNILKYENGKHYTDMMPLSYLIHPALVFDNGFRLLEYSSDSDNFEFTKNGDTPTRDFHYDSCFFGEAENTVSIKNIKTQQVIQFTAEGGLK